MSYRCPTDKPNYCDRTKQLRKGTHGNIHERQGQCAEQKSDCNRNFYDKKGKTGYCTTDSTQKGEHCIGEPDYKHPHFEPQSATHHPQFPPASAVIASQSAMSSSYVPMTPQQMVSSQLSTAVALQQAASKAPMTTEQRMAMIELNDAMAKLAQTMQTPKTDFTVPYAPSRPVTRSVSASVPAPPPYYSVEPSTGVGYTPLDARFKARPNGPDESKGKKRRSKRHSKKNRKSC